MKLKVILPNDTLKALDINLHLEKPNRGKVSTILKVLNEVFMGVLPKDKTRNVTSPISDKTDVVRYDLSDIEKDKKVEIKQIIKYANRDNFFVFLDENDSLKAIVNDYQIIRMYGNNKEANINNLLNNSHYVLNFKMEDIEKNVKLPYARREAREDSPAVERESNIKSGKEKLEGLFQEFMNEVNHINLQKRNIVKKNKPTSEDDILRKERMRLDQMQVGDTFSTDPDRTGYRYLILGHEILQDGNVRLTFEEEGNTETGVQNFDGSTQWYKLIFKPEESKKEEEDTAYEIFLPKEINWRDILESGQSFPNNLLPDDVNRGLRSELKEKWDKMSSIVKREDIELQKSRALETFGERVKNENYRGESNLGYIDKSGYRVSLAKYFTKLLEIPPRVPNEVKRTYEESFAFIEKESKDLVKQIKEHVKQEEWEAVTNLSNALHRFGPKRFNFEMDKYLDESKYDRKDPNSLSKNTAVKKMREFVNFFKEEIGLTD